MKEYGVRIGGEELGIKKNTTIKNLLIKGKSYHSNSIMILYLQAQLYYLYSLNN